MKSLIERMLPDLRIRNVTHISGNMGCDAAGVFLYDLEAALQKWYDAQATVYKYKNSVKSIVQGDYSTDVDDYFKYDYVGKVCFIEPIKEKTADDYLREIVADYENYNGPQSILKAKEFLEKNR